MDAARFPSLSAEALDGTPFVSPRDLALGRMIALIGFAIEHRAEVETWVPFLDALVHARPDVRARLFPATGAPRLMRGAIVRTMKAALTAPELRAATVPIFGDVAAFARSLGINDRGHVAILLVEPDGRITWRGSGPYSEAAAASLTAALELSGML